jgi:flagellar basal body P-ring formation protein FlgA
MLAKLSWPVGLLAAYAVLQGGAVAGVPVRIELAANVDVARQELNLGDIASMATADPQVLRRLMALPLGHAPRAGEKTQLKRVELARWIEQRTGLDARQIVWEGAAVTELKRASSEIPATEIVSAAGENLQSWLSGRSSHADVAVSSMPRDIVVPFGISRLRARPIPQEAPLSKRMVVWVDVWVEDRFVRTVPVGFEVTAYGPAYVVVEDQPLGARFDSTRLTTREVELTGRVAPVLVPPGVGSETISSKQLRRPVSAGKVLTRLDVETQPAVLRGEWVALSVRSGSIDMESRVEVLQNGRIGQTVSVMPAKAITAILARVVGPGHVEITQ